MPWKPSAPGEVPTLGWGVLEWMTENLARPETQEYEPFVPTKEQAEFILRLYELDPVTGQRKVRRAVISRPRGWGKSPFTAAIACAEALGGVLFAGWDSNGQPVGMPWLEVRKPLVEIAAVSEDQVDTNTWSPLVDMLARGPATENYPGLEPMAGFVNLPYGRIQKRTAAAGSAKGAPACFVVCDQTEEWVRANGGVKLYNTLKNNVVKRGGHLLESPNAFTPGNESVAESTMNSYQLVRAGKTRLESGLMFDHREAPPDTDMADRASLMAGLAVAYGDSADVDRCAIHDPPCEAPGWVDLDHIAASIWEPDADPQLSRSDWLNQITHASDSWVSHPEWAARFAPDAVLADRDVVVLGFDGSRGRERGVADATALIGVRVKDGYAFEVGVWEQPSGPAGEGWTPPEHEVEAAVARAFDRWTVVGLYADPTMWDGHVARWQARYGARLKVKAGAQGGMRFPKNQMSRVVPALKSLHGAIVNGEMTHDGSSALTRHVVNARRRTSRSGVFIAKEHPQSARKVDAAYALMLAWQARLDAIGAGVTGERKPAAMIRRVR